MLFKRRARVARNGIHPPPPIKLTGAPELPENAPVMRIREVFGSRSTTTSPPIKRRAKKAPQRVRKRHIVNETNEFEDYPKTQERTLKEQMIQTETENKDTSIETEDATTLTEDRCVNTKSLRQFAVERLPPTSPLRDVILAEKDELTAEEFLAKLNIWLVLFKKEVGG